MSEYHLEIKQVVDYPRCRIYRQLIRELMQDRGIRTGGSPGLFCYTVLCSYANFRTSYRRIDGISYTIRPGEWLCGLQEVKEWFRTRFQYQAMEILDWLQERHLITYSLLNHGKLVRYQITGWHKHNRVLEYNAPCQKDTGFFFLPISVAADLAGMTRCSEMDALLDLWIHTVYNDEQVTGSESGPVVYLRNGTGNPVLCYAELAERWGVSKATAGRYVKKLEELGYVTVMSFPGSQGSAVYLNNYLSMMFEVSDVLLDKEEAAMTLHVKLSMPEEEGSGVSESESGVSESYMEEAVRKVGEILSLQGFPCHYCPWMQYKLLPLSDCEGIYDRRENRKGDRRLLVMSCGGYRECFRFELSIHREEEK